MIDPTRDPPLQAVLEATTPDGDGPPFESSWEARAFAMAVALYDRDAGRGWEAFQARLIDAIQAADCEVDAADVDHDYYRRWLQALEGILVEEGVLTPAEIDERSRAFASGERTAAEFVEGDPESH